VLQSADCICLVRGKGHCLVIMIKGDESSGSIKVGEFLGYLTDW
jgi:hypothetical protein